MSNIQIYNDDCISVLKNIKDKSVDLILTDPPYNIGLFMKKRNANLKSMRQNHISNSSWDNSSYEEWKEIIDNFLCESCRILKDKGALLIFMSTIKIESVINLSEKYDLYYKTTGIWHKINPMPRNMNLHFINSIESWIYFISRGTTGTFNNNGKAIHNFVECAVTPLSERKSGTHSTQKPVKLMKHFIELLSNPNETVVDPFMGVGSTGVASIELERNFIGIEINKEYFETAEKRLVI